ncbi:MAG TPA: hypothetical protein PKD26_01575 [Pyrinomonadaceae bacterium]|nr:hypothetical protein [Pyrinomonadaceae bacterium]
MKRCPECRRDYYDDTLLYCLDDGNALLEGPALSVPPAVAGGDVHSGHEPATAILHSTAAPGEAPTRAQINTTDRTAVLPSSELSGAGPAVSSKRRGHVIAVAGLALIAVVAGGWYLFGGKLFSKPTPFAKISSEELFTGDSILYPALSPDGKLIAYYKRALKDGKDTKMVVVRQLASGAESVIREVDSANVNLWVVSFSPDGEYIYFGENQVGGKGNLYKIATLGGSAQKILEDVTTAAISPDGKKIAFKKSGEPREIYQANIDGSGQQVLLAGADINAGAIILGDWSSDSTKLSMWYWRADMKDEAGATDSPYFIAVLDTANPSGSATERVKVLHEGDWGNDLNTFHWTADGNGLVFPANKVGSPRKADIFYLSYPGGELRQLTDDAANYLDLKVAADGKSLIARTGISLISLWSLDPKTKTAKRLTSEDKAIHSNSLSASDDGRLFFLKRGKGADEFYSMNQDGTDQRKLITRKGTVDGFEVTSDGKYFVASAWSPSGPGNHLYRMDLDGSNEIQLTDVKNTASVNIRLAAGGMIWFTRISEFGPSQRMQIMRMPVAGGSAEKVEGLEPAFHDRNPSPSPNYKYLAYMAWVKDEQTGKINNFVRVVELNDGVAGKKVLEINGDRVPRIRWTPDSSAIVFERESGNRDLFKIDIASKQETQISEFDTNMDTADFVWSQDGTKILLFKTMVLAGIVLIKDTSLAN